MSNPISLFLTRALTLFTFTVMTLSALIYFSFTLLSMIEQFQKISLSIVFVRGAYYMLGVGVSSGALLFIMVIELCAKKSSSDKIIKILVRIVISGLVLAILLPPIAEYLTENYLFKKGYKQCEVPSYSWAIYKDIIYTIDKKTCIKINKENKKKLPSLYPKDDDHVLQHY